VDEENAKYRKLLLGMISLLCAIAPVAFCQVKKGSTENLAFEVASVKSNKSDGEAYMNISPILGDAPVPAGGLYLARNIKLIQFIAFAYSLTQIQLRSVELRTPWTTVDRFDIEARATGSPTKAQYRLMMQSLLAERFKLVAHYETRVVPVYVMALAKPGKLGPQLRLHRADDPACAATPPSPPPGEADAQGFPETCGGPQSMQPSTPGRMKTGGRDVSMARFAAIITGVGVVDRPMIDQTGIKGTIDYSLEWRRVSIQLPPGATVEPDEDAPTFQQAMKEQLGIRMVSRKGPSELFFIDHVEKPSEN
jgi:uncharacterized protein (TIGR03435 family)